MEFCISNFQRGLRGFKDRFVGILSRENTYCNRKVIGKKGGELFVNPTMILMSVGVVCLQFSLVGQMKGELKSLEVEEEEEEEEEEEKKRSAASQAKKPAR